MSDSETKNAFERAQLYRELHRDFLDRFNKTRDFEWIINGALWAGIILTGHALYGHVATGSVPCWLFFVGPIGAWLAHFLLWMFAIQNEEDIDQHRADGYRVLMHHALEGKDLNTLQLPPKELQDALEAAIEHLPDRPYRARFERPYRFYGGIRWSIIECATTSILVLGVLLLLDQVPYRETNEASRSAPTDTQQSKAAEIGSLECLTTASL